MATVSTPVYDEFRTTAKAIAETFVSQGSTPAQAIDNAVRFLAQRMTEERPDLAQRMTEELRLL